MRETEPQSKTRATPSPRSPKPPHPWKAGLTSVYAH